MTPTLIKFVIWFVATFIWVSGCHNFKERHKKELSSAGKDILFSVAKYGVPAFTMNAIGLADEISVVLGL